MSSSMRNYSDASRLPDLHDYIRFDDYEDTVKMWSLVSNICYTMQGPVLLKSIPEHSDMFGRNLRQDICRAVGGFECVTNNPRGVDKILNCMREICGVENVLSLGFKVFKEFKECERKEGQCMRSFIFEFDHKYRRCKRIDMVFQDVMLYVILLSAANLNKNQRMLFKAVFNMEQDNLYERMKQTMMRLFSNNI